MSRFDSLTLALEGWFDATASDLPDALRLRVERDFSSSWERMSADQRRSEAREFDDQHDPATEQDRQFWWDFFHRRSALTTQIAQWEGVATPTAGDLALSETRLKELRIELARMDVQQRQARGNGGSESNRLHGENEASSTSQDSPPPYVAYPKAMRQLSERLKATPEELAAWVWSGPKIGGLSAFMNANELDPPPRFHFGFGDGSGDDHDYVSPLMACWFGVEEIARFEPTDRYITGSALIQRWSNQPGLKPLAFIQAKIRESRLSDLHPIYGITQGSDPEDSSSPPLTEGLFRLSDVEAIEAEDFPVDWDQGVGSTGDLDSGRDREAATQEAIAATANTRAESLPAEQPTHHTSAAEVGASAAGGVAAASPCAVFRAMQNLRADELTIAFVGDRSDAGPVANNILEISARQTTRRVALASLDLLDRRTGAPNSQAVILLGMAARRRLYYTTTNAAKMSRLRDVLRNHLGLASDPFQPYRKSDGWVPFFTLIDKRGAADERAKREGERRTESFDELAERGAPLQVPQDSHRPYEVEGDDADFWLRENGRGDSA